MNSIENLLLLCKVGVYFQKKKLVKSKFCILENFFHFGARPLIDCFLEVSKIKKDVQSNKYGFLK